MDDPDQRATSKHLLDRFDRNDLAWLFASTAGLICVILLSIFSWYSVARANVHERRVRQVIRQIRTVQIRLTEAETGQRGYLLTGDLRYLQPYSVAISALRTSLPNLQASLVDEGHEAEGKQLLAVIAEKLYELQRTVDMRSASGLPAALKILETDRGFHAMQLAISLISNLESQLLRHADALSLTVTSRLRKAALVTSVACSLLFILFLTANAQLRKQRQQALTANRAKSAFLAAMSHELRTPLNAIIGYSEMLVEEADAETSTPLIADLNKIHLAGRHLLMLINSILDLSKVESGKMELFVETFPISTLVDEVVTVIQPLAQKNNNRLEVKLESGIGVIQSDQTKLRQCLYNLLSNACKFTQNGIVTLAVATEAAAAESREQIVFSVSDTGIGLEETQIKKIFEPFTQADQSTSRRYGGTGLGLALTRMFTVLMGGQIFVRSRPDEGATFTIKIPRFSEKQKSSIFDKNTSEILAEGQSTLMVIDDDASTHELVSRSLAKTGFHVVSAYNGQEGLRLARKLHPAVITLDVMMPGIDGWNTLSALKADPDLSDIPVIMLTITDNQNLGYILGATDYLTKPLDREKLLRILARYKRPLSSDTALVVEDDLDSRSLLRRALESEGWKVEEAVNGRAALQYLDTDLPGIVLLDLMMPEMDGFEFVHELRQRPEAKKIPVIVLTAKELTTEDWYRLQGVATKVLQKGAQPTEEVLREISDLVVSRAQPSR